VLIGLTGCITVGPDYKTIEPDAPNNWQAPMEQGLREGHSDNHTLAKWWTLLGDETLVQLEEIAMQGNLDIKIALSRIREARAMRGIEKARLFPTLNVSSTFEERRNSENLMENDFQNSESSDIGDEYEYYMAGLIRLGKSIFLVA